MDANKSRRELEERIVESVNSIDIMKEGGIWIDDNELRNFLDLWWELVRYYADHRDTEIGVLALREYVDFTRLLRKLEADDTVNSDHRRKATEVIGSLEYYIDEIIREAVTNLENPE